MQKWIAAAVLALAFVPLAQAQGPLDDSDYNKIVVTPGAVTGLITEDNISVIPYNGTASVAVGVTVGCFALSQHASDPKVTVAVENTPAWLVATPIVFDFTPTQAYQPCKESATAGYAFLGKPMPLTVKSDAPGIVKQYLNLTATMSANAAGRVHAARAPLVQPLQVQFHPNYTVTPSVSFPLTVTNGVANFTVTIENRGNARNMVMIEGMHVTSGSLSGIGPETYEVTAKGGVDTMVFQVSFKAPEQWTESTVSFKAVSHFLLNAEYGAGEFRAPQDIKWVFVNGSPNGGPEPSQEAPVPMLPFYMLAILGAAIVASRRR